ncbi:MAG: hypothetical protein IKK08_08480 [Clostridia bacterium]|nr:hypothetical protein [Clostridia bacterium]
MDQYSVFVQTDDQGRVIGINSDAFLPSTDGWEKVAEGHGDKFHHAQGNYLPQPVYDEEGRANWKLEGGQPILRTDAEKAADVQPDAQPPAQGEQIAKLEEQITELENRIAELNQALDMLLEGVTEDE